MIELDPATTALVLIDLQKGILSTPRAPYTSEEAFAKGTDLAARFRAAAAPVVRVHVDFKADYSDAPSNLVDAPTPRPAGGYGSDFAAFPDDPAALGDLIVMKRHWGAFHGTDLDLLLRRRGVRTIVLGGISTSIGVESTARSAHEHGYDIVMAEDATTDSSAEAHAFAFRQIFPRLARVAKVADIRLATR
jgi:nicotinamidase-related amidase